MERVMKELASLAVEAQVGGMSVLTVAPLFLGAGVALLEGKLGPRAAIEALEGIVATAKKELLQ